MAPGLQIFVSASPVTPAARDDAAGSVLPVRLIRPVSQVLDSAVIDSDAVARHSGRGSAN